MRRAAVAVAVVVLFLIAAGVTACGTPAAAGPPASAPARGPSADASAPELAATDGLPSLDALAARGPADAPLMREALRVDAAAPRSAEVRAEKDLCLRAVFASLAAVRASFADESGALRGEATSGVSGTVPPRGPVCVKKGEALHLLVESTDGGSSAPSARAVIFAAP